MTNTWNLARKMAEHGVAVIPVPPKEKGCKLLDWPQLATTDINQINNWAETEPDGNYGCVCTPESVVVLDADNPGLRSQIERTTGRDFPDTLTVRSSKGYHYYFKQTDRSRAVGNRNVADLFDLQSNRKYVVGAGSIHPSGAEYTVINSVDIVPMPDWLADHLDRLSLPRKRKSAAPSLHEDFDEDDFFSWYEEQNAFFIEGHRNWNDNDVHITDHCIIAGYKHSGSWHTGFIVGNDQFGYHCESPECDNPSVGDVLRKLNELGYKQYPKPIWEEPELEGVVMLDEDELPEPVPVPETKQIIEDIEALLNDPPEPDTAELEEPETEGHSEPEAEPEVDTPVDTEKPAIDPAIRIAASCPLGENGSIGLMVKDASSYVMTELQWLWPQRIPAGKITLFTGKPDCGKSLALLDLIARVSTGRDFADGSKNENGACKVLLAASEDDPTDTLIPRLKAVGADLTNIAIIEGTVVATQKRKSDKPTRRRTKLDLKRDAKLLLGAIKAHPDISLLALDPITSFFGDNADVNKDKDIRPIMEEISRVCNKSGITIVGIVHSSKRSDVDAVHKVSGAGALAAVVRAVWGFSRDTEDKSKYYMAHVKGNLGKDKSGLEYTIEETMVDIPGKSVGIPRIVWGAKSELDADELLKLERNNKDAKDFKLEAARILISTLKLPMKAVEIYEKAEAQGISSTSMKRAKAELGLLARKKLNVWWWYPAGSVEKAFPNSEAEITVADSDIEAVL
jgi:putative DNA primase/helicase